MAASEDEELDNVTGEDPVFTGRLFVSAKPEIVKSEATDTEIYPPGEEAKVLLAMVRTQVCCQAFVFAWMTVHTNEISACQV